MIFQYEYVCILYYIHIFDENKYLLRWKQLGNLICTTCCVCVCLKVWDSPFAIYQTLWTLTITYYSQWAMGPSKFETCPICWWHAQNSFPVAGCCSHLLTERSLTQRLHILMCLAASSININPGSGKHPTNCRPCRWDLHETKLWNCRWQIFEPKVSEAKDKILVL